MKKWLPVLLSMATLALSVQVFAADAPALSKDALEHIAKHEAIAAAHTEAAKCLRAGKPEAVCEAPLLPACKGIAIGKFCGMKH